MTGRGHGRDAAAPRRQETVQEFVARTTQDSNVTYHVKDPAVIDTLAGLLASQRADGSGSTNPTHRKSTPRQGVATPTNEEVANEP
jgi:hypothetical protein